MKIILISILVALTIMGCGLGANIPSEQKVTMPIPVIGCTCSTPVVVVPVVK